MSLAQSEWFTEIYENGTAFSVRYSKKLLDETGEFQRVEIFDTDVMGRVLILNGCFMVTEKDSFIYHEMLAHPGMAMAPSAKKVLIIGGGDGGVVTELVKYPHLESVILCEIDPLVISSCKEYFPAISAGLSDPRVQIVCRDGAAYVEEFEEEFDLVLVDSTDPVGPGVALFQTSFYWSIKKSLTKRGAAVFQTESPIFMEKVFADSVADLRKVFGEAAATPYLATIPSYPGALWSFTFCSQNVDPIKQAPTAVDPTVQGRLDYYSPEAHAAAFALPVFVQKILEPPSSR
jgi:spermidine synthase